MSTASTWLDHYIAEKNAVVDYDSQIKMELAAEKLLYEHFRQEIEDFANIRIQIRQSVGKFSSLNYFMIREKIDDPSRREITMHYNYDILSIYHSKMTIDTAVSIFESTKYGDVSLVNLLKSKLEKPCRISVFNDDKYIVKIYWPIDELKKDGCKII